MKEFFTGTGPLNPQFKIGGTAHILWFVLPLVIIALLSLLFSKNKKAGKITIIVLAVVMLVLRVVKYGYIKPVVWEESWRSIVPFELCTIMSFILPLTVFFKTKRLNVFIYPLAIFGGIITLAYPEWIYNGYGLNFNKLESLIVHISLVAIPIFSAVSNFNFKFNIKDYYKPVLAMILLVVYAFIANTYITPGANHMFIKNNPLPFEIAGLHHMVLFSVGFLVILFLMYLPEIIKAKVKKKKKG